jgi:hypothetical protein
MAKVLPFHVQREERTMATHQAAEGARLQPVSILHMSAMNTYKCSRPAGSQTCKLIVAYCNASLLLQVDAYAMATACDLSRRLARPPDVCSTQTEGEPTDAIGIAVVFLT